MISGNKGLGLHGLFLLIYLKALLCSSLLPCSYLYGTVTASYPSVKFSGFLSVLGGRCFYKSNSPASCTMSQRFLVCLTSPLAAEAHILYEEELSHPKDATIGPENTNREMKSRLTTGLQSKTEVIL